MRQVSEVQLKILATSDLHANLLSYDYAKNQPIFGQGLAQAVSLIAAERAANPNAILLDNGDFLQGNALADMAFERRSSRMHPVIAAMNAIGYDAAALGNHEFNFGLDLLAKAIAHARFPMVSANILTTRGERPEQDKTYAAPFTIIERVLPDQTGQMQRVNVGVIGLTPVEILLWDRRHLIGRLDARPMVEAAKMWVPILRKAGADLVICLAHTGIPQGWAQEEECHAATLARLDGIDALIAGHTHRVFPFRGTNPDPQVVPNDGTIAGKPVVQPGFNGSTLGVIDLSLQKRADGWNIASARAQAISVSEVTAGLSQQHIRTSAKLLRAAILPDHRATLAWVRRPLGRSTVAMSTFFAQVGLVPIMSIIAESKIDYVRKHLKGSEAQSLPILAAVSAYRTGGRGGVMNYSQLLEGDVSMRHVLDLMPFPNTLVAHQINGAEIREFLERNAAAFHQVTAGLEDQPLINPAFPTFSFTTIHGLSYRFDLTQKCRYGINGMLVDPKSRRVADLTFNGQPVTDDMRFILASNSFRTGGGMGHSRPGANDVVLDDNTLCSQMLRDYLAGIGTITEELVAAVIGKECWRIKSIPGASVFLDTGIAAEDHLQEAALLRPTFTGLTESGFRRYRLHL